MIGTVIVSGLPSEAAFQLAGMPFSFWTASSDIARTSEETATIVRIKNEAHAVKRAIEQRRCFISFCLYFSLGIVNDPV